MGIHGELQSLKNLQYILNNEKNFINCKKIFIINKIISKDIEKKIINEIKKYNAIYYVVPFEYNKFIEIFNKDHKKLNKDEVRDLFNPYKINDKIQKFLKSINYLIDINNVRNFAAEIGLSHANTVLIFDGNSFLTDDLYFDFESKCKKNNKEKNLFIFPVHRLKNYEQIFKKEEYNFYYEPQIGFQNIKLKFDPNCFYTDFDKVEFLLRHGVEGYWNKWKKNDQNYEKESFNKIYCKGVFRLPTHTEFDLDKDVLTNTRKKIRNSGIMKMLELAVKHDKD